MERRLTAIFAADMVGYSRLIEANEVGTITRQKRHRAELIDPMIAQHGGRIIKLTGDGMIAEFPSVVEAVQCAVSVQREMEARETDVAEDRKIRYRIAINLGDVVFDDGDVYGDGVNIAARLEALADPGGVVVSGTAYDHLKSNIEVGYQDLGERQVKNIATPVRVYRVVPDGGPAPPKPAPRRRVGLLLPATVTLLVVAAIAVWEFAIRPEPVDATMEVDREALLAIPEGPTLAVLRFVNRSGDPEQDWFAEGVSLEIMAELGHHPRLKLIARTSTFPLKGNDRAPSNVREALGADYVLDGYVQRLETRVRVHSDLYETRNGSVVWSETFDEELTAANLFDVQSLIAKRTAVAVGEPDWGAIISEQKKAARGKPPASLSAYECTLFSAGNWYRPGAMKRMFECAQNAIEREPDYAPAWAALSMAYRMDAFYGFGVTGLGGDDAALRAVEAAETAVRLSPNDHDARYNLAASYVAAGMRDRFLMEARSFLKLGWQSTNRMAHIGLRLIACGEHDLGESIIKKSMHLSGANYPRFFHTGFSIIEGRKGNFAKSLKEYQKSAIPGYWMSNLGKARHLVTLDRIDEAREKVRLALEKKPNYTVMDYAVFLRRWCYTDDEIGFWADALIKAGLPSGGYGE